MPDFASRFNAALETKGISRRELARLSGVHVNTLNNWAGGEVPNPHPTLLRKIAPILGVSYEWLRIGEGPMVQGARARLTARDFQGVSERIAPGESYARNGEDASFDPELMEQVIRLVEDHCRLFRKRLDETRRVGLMERAYRICVEAGLSGQSVITLSRFQELLRLSLEDDLDG